MSRVFLVVIVEAAGKDGFEFNGRQKANRVAITIEPRAVVGNPNDRFDPGDAYLLQKFFRAAPHRVPGTCLLMISLAMCLSIRVR